MTTEDGVPETEEEIQDRIDDIHSDIQSLSMDLEISPAEILLKIVMTMIRECGDATKEGEKESAREFLQALVEKAVA